MATKRLKCLIKKLFTQVSNCDTLGLWFQFGMMETIIVGVTDRFPDTVGQHRIKFVLLCCIVGFLLGLPLTTKVRISVVFMYKTNVTMKSLPWSATINGRSPDFLFAIKTN